MGNDLRVADRVRFARQAWWSCSSRSTAAMPFRARICALRSVRLTVNTGTGYAQMTCDVGDALHHPQWEGISSSALGGNFGLRWLKRYSALSLSATRTSSLFGWSVGTEARFRTHVYGMW
jgi:hypothetical protein